MQSAGSEPEEQRSVVTAEERAIEKDPNGPGPQRDRFDQLYEMMRNEKPKINIELPEEPVSKKQKKSKKEVAQSVPIEVAAHPVEERAIIAEIAKEQIGTDFATVQAAGKIEKLLERGEEIAYLGQVKQRKFLKPDRIRKIVITTSGRVFCTNIGGDGILSTIEINNNSLVSVHEKKLDVRGLNGSFHFIVDDPDTHQTLVNKLRECC